jgi:hypothetical protein
MITHVHLTVAKPWADVSFTGELDGDGITLLTEVVETARALGCRRITLRVERAGESEERLAYVVDELRQSYEPGDVSLEIVSGDDRERAHTPV